MSKEEDILTFVLNALSNIRELVSNTKNIEEALEDFKLGKTDDAVKIIENVKRLIEDVYTSSCDLRKEFKEKVNLNKTPDEAHDENQLNGNIENDNSKEDESVGNNLAENIESDNPEKSTSKEQKGKGKGLKVRISNRNKVENISDKSSDDELESDQESKDTSNEGNKNSEESVDVASNTKEKNGKDKLDNNTSSDIIDSSLIENDQEKKNNSKEQNKENIDLPNEVPKIRLVALSKLIDPQRKKSVKFDSSVIILTSSDEENTTPKKVMNDKENGVLKSALKKKFPVEKIESGLLESNNKQSSPKKKSSKRNRNKETSSENSDSEKETDRKKIKLKIKLNPLSSVSNNEISISDHSDSEDSDAGGRKSSRLRSKAKETEKRREKLHKKFEKTREAVNKKIVRTRATRSKRDIIEKLSDTSSLSDESDYDEKHKNNEGRNKNKTPGISSSDEVDKSSKSKKKIQSKSQKTQPIPMDVDDEKFKYEVYVPLPRYECNQLKDIYLHNKEILEIKRLTNLKPLKKKSSKKKQKVNEESESEKKEDEDEPSKKKQKNKSKSDSTSEKQQPPESKETSEKQDDKAEDEKSSNVENDGHKTTSEDEHPDKETVSNKEADDKMSDEVSDGNKELVPEIDALIAEPIDSEPREDNPLTADEYMANMALNELQDNDDKNDSDSEINNSDEENKLSKKTKKKTNENEDKKKKDRKEDKEDDKKSEHSDNEKESDKEEEEGKKSEDDVVNTKDTNEDQKSKDDKETEDKNEEQSDKENDSEKENDNESTKSKADNKTSDSDESEPKRDDKKKEWQKDKLLTEKLDSSDSEENFGKFCKKKEKAEKELLSEPKKKTDKAEKRKMKRSKVVITDSDESGDDKKDESSSEEEKSDAKSSSESNSEQDKEKEGEKTPARKRIKRVRDSSSSEEDKSTRKHIRRVLDRDSLSETTKKAEAEEKERKARIAEKQKKYNNIFEEKLDATIDKIVLEYDERDDKKELLAIDKKLVEKLKPHQANGIRFMWDACFENLKRAKKEQGSGCILAHCMGLGKTLQVIALIHTLLKNSKVTGVEKILVVCPVNTVLNWKAEFKKWLPRKSNLEVYELVTCKQNYERQYTVNEWHEDGGVLIIGYTMFRNLSSPDNKRLSKKMREVFAKGFVDPGPDLVICDEGHLLKNEKTHLSIAMNRIKTARRIVLTGTPLQNNLKEYWCMVQFIKPNLLGTYKEYLNRFVNPITNGQYTDSTQHDIMLMRKRSHVLHKLLDGVVQRRDYSVLEPYLPPKHEYVLFVKLSPIQIKLYQVYMENYARKNDGSNRTSFLFTDFQQLQRICTHPRVLGDKSTERKDKLDDDDDDEEDSEGSLKDFIDDNDESSAASTSSSSSGSEDSDGSDDNRKEKKKKKAPAKTRVTRAQAAQRRDNNEMSEPELEAVKKEWWQEYCDGDELDNIDNSGKLSLLFQILKECEEIGDKILIFSQSLLTLNCIEYFLEKIDEATQNGNSEKVGGYTGSWAIGLDYFRLDGSSSCDNRATWCDLFNNPKNTRARLFLISTKAGGLGINLVAANRVIIFDVSWNPSHDIQSIYRVYRFGQTKPCYIYRFVTYGAMEMKIYERQVTKQAISKRVIDEQQIDRHYNQNDLQELYKCDLEPKERPIPLVPKDVLLAEMLQKYSDTIFNYHIHQSLLENKEEEGLNEAERKAAWEEFENEKVLRKTYSNTFAGANLNLGTANVNPQLIASALRNIVKHDNPAWSDVQINGIIPALVQQLQAQLAENDTSMYTRVTQEIQRMQVEKMRYLYFQQQIRAMQARQQTTQARQQALWNEQKGDSYFVDPIEIRNMVYGNSNRVQNQPGPSTANNLPLSTTEVIDLND